MPVLAEKVFSNPFNAHVFKRDHPVDAGVSNREVAVGGRLPSLAAEMAPTYLATRAQPRIGFLGLGWTGRHRLKAIAQSGAAEVVGLADPISEMIFKAAQIAPRAYVLTSFDHLLNLNLDGIVIATPSALHAEQAITALEHGLAVFCQEPIGQTATDVDRVVNAARLANRLLAGDLSYRYIRGVETLRDLIRSGELGDIFAVDLVFHDAYGPDKSSFYDSKLSGGGCLLNQGIHLVDLALWALDYPRIKEVWGYLYAGGKRLTGLTERKVEDYATALLNLENGATFRLACSWHLPAGAEAVIEATFYGSRGGVSLRNLTGSPYDFNVEHIVGARRQTISAPPDTPHPYAWGGRAVVEWASRLAAGERFDPEVEHLVEVAAALDAIYGR